MELEGISEETLGENLRVRSDSNEILSSPRRESKLMAAAGIDYGRKRRLHSHSIGSFSGSAGDSSRIYQQGDQVSKTISRKCVYFCSKFITYL